MRSPLHDAFSGLAPTRGSSCSHCGRATLSFANGRNRLDICQHCGTAEGSTQDGLELFSMKGLKVRQE